MGLVVEHSISSKAETKFTAINFSTQFVAGD